MHQNALLNTVIINPTEEKHMNPSKLLDPRFWRLWANSGAVNYKKLVVEVRCGAGITNTISKAIEMVRVVNERFSAHPLHMLSFTFNGVNVGVCQDSDPELIHRDWSRTMSGYISGKIGPYPKTELSFKELANDESIRKEHKARRAEEQAAYRVAQAQKEREFFAELETCPAMERDETKWQEGISAQTEELGRGIYLYAEYWARLMQKKMSEDSKMEEIADECSSKADIPCGMSGFSYGCAVSILAQCWKHGEELRRWHNKRYQFHGEGDEANESGGVLNPALLRIAIA